jgi:Type II CAAX prenyl endopeptidase Rce1-like
VRATGAPTPLRRSVAVELAALAALTALYLWLLPRRPLALDVAMALVAGALLAATWRHTRERVWAFPTAPAPERRRRAALVLAATAVVALGFGAIGLVGACPSAYGWDAIGTRLFRPTFFGALAFFLPWALLQQTLFQFYLLGRLRVLLPAASPVTLSVANGILFGAAHLPEWEVALITVPAGVVWSYSYCLDRALGPLAVSHAVLGATYFYWARGNDLLLALLNKL